MSTSFYPLRVVHVERETDEAVALTLQPNKADQGLFRFKPGQHLTLRTEIGGEDVRRNYSLFVAPADGTLRVAIKRIAGGAFSSWAMTQIKAGDVVESMIPRGNFTFAFGESQRRNYVAFAAGSGITPILSLLKAGLGIERESQFTLLYGNRTSSSIMFLEQIAALKDHYLGRLQVYHFLDAEADDVDLFNGRLDQARVSTILETLVDPAQIDAAFICGPGPMMDTAEGALRQAGVDPNVIMVERFSAGRPAGASVAVVTAGPAADRVEMQVVVDGRRRTVAFDPALGNILDSARAAGLPAPYACKAGVCATCRAKLVAGKVEMAANYGLSKAEIEAGYILTCQASPVAGDVWVDYDG